MPQAGAQKQIHTHTQQNIKRKQNQIRVLITKNIETPYLIQTLN